MRVNSSELYRRKLIAQAAAELAPVEADSIEDLRQAALEALSQKIDNALKNLQPGEKLAISFEIHIVDPSGNVRSPSGWNRNMPDYAAWRTAVFERDEYRCQECDTSGELNAHHIKSWADHPELRFDVSNGIALCPECHAKKHPHIGFVGA